MLDIGCGTGAFALLPADRGIEVVGVDPAQASIDVARAKPGGHLVFETRDPARRAWEEWNRETSYKVTDIPGSGAVESWVQLIEGDRGRLDRTRLCGGGRPGRT